jgi:hypothetical protein
MLKRSLLVDLCAACGSLLIVATLVSAVYAGVICRDGFDLPPGVPKGQTQGKMIYRCGLNEDITTGLCNSEAPAKYCDVSEPKCKCRDMAISRSKFRCACM